VQGRGAAYLGVCVGMPALASAGLEFGEPRGSTGSAAQVRAAGAVEPLFKVPHMGWNALTR